MNEHQRIDAALCDKPGGNNRLAEGGRRRQHTDLMFQHRVGGQLLLRSQLALKGHLQWLSAVAFVVLRRREVHTKNTSSSLGFVHDIFQMSTLNAAHCGKKGPLIVIRDAPVVEEDTVTVTAALLL